MIENLLTGFIGATLGCIVAVAVIKERLRSVDQRLDGHDKHFERVVYRDVCSGCKGRGDERHAELIRRLESVEKAFRDCVEDLLKELRTNHNG